MIEPEQDFEPAAYNFVFHNNVCHVCKKTENLKRCSQCKTLAYCSRSHQRIDWKWHKTFCNALFEVMFDLDKIKINNFEDFVQIKKIRYLGLTKKLEKLQEYEMDMWMHPRYCEVCFSENPQLDCPKCKNVFFCSENHQNAFKVQHGEYCDELKLAMETKLSIFNGGLGDTNYVVSDIANEIQNLPDSLTKLLSLYDKNSNSLVFEVKLKILKLQCISPVASILYGLEKCGHLKNRLFKKKELCVHIVGGGLYEMGFLMKEMFELTFHWISNLTKLEYFIVGPELHHNGSTEKFTEQLCNSCKSKNAVTRCTFHSQLYHNIVNHISKPDVIVCFNSGLHVNSTTPKDEPEHDWDLSIKYLVKQEAPLILTAYTFKEIVSDNEEIRKKTNITVLVEPQINPFRDRKPIKDFENQVPPVFYQNGFISVLKKGA